MVDAGKGEPSVSDLNHPAVQRLEAFVEETLELAERATVRSHVLACPRCQTEVDELRGLFAALTRLQHFSPAPGFVQRVMAHVKLPEPWWRRAGSYFQPVVPRTTRGWAFASALFALPLVGVGAVMLWVLSKPYVTSENLVAFTLQQIGTYVSSAFNSAVSILIQSNLTLLLARGLEAFSNSGLRSAGAVALMFAGLTVLSAWVLYQNLFRTPARRSDYASYSF
jgi:hypothetical protein